MTTLTESLLHEQNFRALLAQPDGVKTVMDEIKRLQSELAAEKARRVEAEKDRDNLLWNLAGCDTLASGHAKPFDYAKELARPALDSVSKLVQERDALRTLVTKKDEALKHFTTGGIVGTIHPVNTFAIAGAALALTPASVTDELKEPGEGIAEGQLSNAGTMMIHGEELIGLFVSMTREELAGIKRLPMYKRVRIVEVEQP